MEICVQVLFPSSKLTLSPDRLLPCSKLLGVPAGRVHGVQSLTADQPELLVQHQGHLEGLVACHHLACTLEVVLCSCGP